MDLNIKNVFLVSSEARLLAFSGVESEVGIDEDRVAELMEDFLFMVSSRKHYEDLFGMLRYLHIRHNRTDTFLLPFENDKLICICVGTLEYDETQFLHKIQTVLRGMYRYAESTKVHFD